MSYSKGHNVNCNRVTLGGIFADDSDTIDIVHSDPAKKILVNGVEPSAGGGGGVTDPLNLNNINAAVAMTTPSITPPAAGGGLVIKANGLIKPDGAGETLNISATTMECVDGDFSTNNGNVRVQGTGFISCGTTISANGNITTGAAADINTGRDFIFNGQDIYKSYPGIVPVIPNKTYKEYKGLVATGDNAIFTGEPVFRETVKVQTTDGAVPPTLTDQITLNKNGTVQCSNANIGSALTVGTITCDNGGVNECKARLFNTRTSGTAGWNITQALEEAAAPQNAANNILQFAATQAQAAGIPTSIYVTASDYDPSAGDTPSIVLDPVTTASGGRVSSSQFELGTTGGRYVLKQDIGGPLNDVMQITAPTATAEVHFKGNTGGDLLKVGSTVTCNPPLVASGTVDVGSTLDVVGNVSLTGATSAIRFGLYSFKPRQLYKDITSFSYNSTAIGATNLIFRTDDTDWVNVNTGATGQSLDLGTDANKGAYKLTFRQTSGGALGQINDFRLMSDIVLSRPNDSAPNVILPSATAYSYEAYDGIAPEITMKPGFLVWEVFTRFPSVSGSETSNVRITLTQMPYFG